MLSTERPIIADLKSSSLQIALDALAIVALAAIWGMTIYRYSQLPESIPRHFNASGEPDAWGSKSIALVLPIVTLVMYASLTILNRVPHRFNYLWTITERNARSQYQLARELLSAVKASFSCIFAYIAWASLETGLGTRQGLGGWFLPTTVSATFIILVVYFVRARRAKNS